MKRHSPPVVGVLANPLGWHYNARGGATAEHDSQGEAVAAGAERRLITCTAFRRKLRPVAMPGRCLAPIELVIAVALQLMYEELQRMQAGVAFDPDPLE